MRDAKIRSYKFSRYTKLLDNIHIWKKHISSPYLQWQNRGLLSASDLHVHWFYASPKFSDKINDLTLTHIFQEVGNCFLRYTIRGVKKMKKDGKVELFKVNWPVYLTTCSYFSFSLTFFKHFCPLLVSFSCQVKNWAFFSMFLIFFVKQPGSLLVNIRLGMFY